MSEYFINYDAIRNKHDVWTDIGEHKISPKWVASFKDRDMANEYIEFKDAQQQWPAIDRRMKDRRLPAILREQAGFEDDHT